MKGSPVPRTAPWRGSLQRSRSSVRTPPQGPAVWGSGPRSTQTQVSSADQNLPPHPLLMEGHRATERAGDRLCARGHPVGGGSGPTRSGAKKERKRMHQVSQAVTRETALPGGWGTRGQPPRAGQMEGEPGPHWGGLTLPLHAGTRGHLLPGPRSISAPHTISRSLGTSIISKHRAVNEEPGGGGWDLGGGRVPEATGS